MPFAGDVIVLGRVLQRVCHVDDTAQSSNPEGRIALREIRSGEAPRMWTGRKALSNTSTLTRRQGRRFPRPLVR